MSVHTYTKESESSKVYIKSPLKRSWDRNKFGFLFIAPWFLGFIIFNLFPMIYSLYLSFTSFDFFSSPQFIGLDNFINLFTKDARFFNAARVTFKYVMIGVPLQLAFALLLAIALNKGIPGLKYFRAIYYLPALLGGSVAIAILWRQVFGIEGILNQLLSFLGFSEELATISWFANPKYSLYTLIILRVWQFGSPMVIFLAGIKQIPQELYESAAIDGANGYSQFIHITAPLLTPIIFFNLIMQIISAFQDFTPAYIVGGANGGTLDSLLFYTLYLYIRGFRDFKMGNASAMAWILLAIIAIFTVILFKTSNKWVYYDS